jgi:Polysaccharide biosynthesis/export protein
MRTTATIAMGLMMLMAGCRQPMVEVNGCFMPRDEAIRRGLVAAPLSEKERQEQMRRRQELFRLGQIDIGDVLSVAVDEDPSLTGDYDVRPDGTVTICYLDPIPVYGLTDAEAAGRISDFAKHLLKKATVRVKHRVDGRKLMKTVDHGKDAP